MMRGLTLHRPWDFAIAHGGKDVENRPWKPWPSVIGERIALHAGNHFDEDGWKFIARTLVLGSEEAKEILQRPAGVIVATTRVAGWVFRNAQGTIWASDSESALDSPWFFGPYGWVLRDTIALPEPVPCKGALGLWKLPPAVEVAVLLQEDIARSKSA